MSDKELSTKKRSVAGYRRHLKITESEIDTLFSDFDTTNEDHRTRLLALQASYQDKLGNIRNLDEQILYLIKESDYDEEFDSIMQENEKSYEIIVCIDKHLQPTLSSSSSAGKSPVSTTSTTSTSTDIKAKLPKIELSDNFIFL